VITLKQESTDSNCKVRVSAPARLHLGFLDLNGKSGRKFGGIGLAIDTQHTVIEAQLAATTSIEGIMPSSKLHQKIITIIDIFYDTLAKHIPVDEQSVQLSIIKLIPEHTGLGSGTQLALTIGNALCQLNQIPASTIEIADQLGRGSRSGIGIATFDHGGFIIDGGLSETSHTPPLLAHYDFPENWRVVLITDNAHQGVHGTQEIAAFKNLPSFPLNNSQAICHLTLMKLLPALVEQKIEPFGHAITEIQTLIGDHFAPAQGGRYTSQHVATVLNYAQSIGHTGIAQSSWGPTGCIFVESDQIAQQLIQELKHYAEQQIEAPSELVFSVAQASNSGANIEIVTT
jgi:beta-ribofuranosylaminobenzene 5'-phosphate synthase